MPKRAPKSTADWPRATLVLAATAIAFFIGGEALILARTDKGQLWEARYLRVGDPARITLLIGKQIRQGLDAAGVPAESIQITVLDRAKPPVRWRVGLRPEASLFRVNHAVQKALEKEGAEVLEGHEHPGNHGDLGVELVVGLPGRATHEVTLMRPAPGLATQMTAPRLAVVLYGFGEDPKLAESFVRLPARFAVALPPAEPWSSSLFRAAREQGREAVLSLPLEPLNYPRLNPGPGTILVNMKPAKIASMMKSYLDQAGPVVAVANHMGSLATQDAAVVTTVYRELHRRRLPFLHVEPAAAAVCKPLASELGVVYDKPDFVMDLEPLKSYPRLEARWSQILKQARHREQSIVMIRATPLVERWLPRALAAKRLQGIDLDPLASLLKHAGPTD